MNTVYNQMNRQTVEAASAAPISEGLRSINGLDGEDENKMNDRESVEIDDLENCSAGQELSSRSSSSEGDRKWFSDGSIK